jgi:predicted nucleic acid-binding protein
MIYLLDTNLTLDFIRNNALSTKLATSFDWFSSENTTVISIATEGEMYAIARKNDWGKRRIENLTKNLSNFLIIPIDSEDIVQAYAEIDAYSQGKLENKPLPKGMTARNMGKNDLWIAATAYAIGAKFFTTDKDFTHLQDTYLDIHITDWQKCYE